MRNIGIFLDVSNLYYCVTKKYHGSRINYNRLMEAVAKNTNVVRAIAYGAQLTNEANAFITALKCAGLETKYKTPKIYRDPKNPNREIRKANWDIGIAVDIMKVKDRLDEVILGSADGDFTPLVQYLIDSGLRVVIIGCEISGELKECASDIIEITEELLNNEKAIRA